MADLTWSSDELDLDGYLSRTGYRGGLEPTAATLLELHRHHVLAIPFENLEIMLGRPVRLDLADLQAKLVGRRRGGYCFEHNLLFAAVLERLGYTVTGLSARVTMGSDRQRPTTHMCLRVEIDGEPWLADVGFGGDGLLEPIPLRPGPKSRQGAAQWTFSVSDEGPAGWVLWSHRGQALSLYTFTLEPRWPIDYRVLNWYVSTYPGSAFTGRVIVQRVAMEHRSSLLGSAMTRRLGDGTEELGSVGAPDLPTVLAEEFGIELDDEEVRRLLARQA